MWKMYHKNRNVSKEVRHALVRHCVRIITCKTRNHRYESHIIVCRAGTGFYYVAGNEKRGKECFD